MQWAAINCLAKDRAGTYAFLMAKGDEPDKAEDDLEARLGTEIAEALLALDELSLDDPEEALATFDTLPEPVQALVDFQLLNARAHQALGQLEAARDILFSLLPAHEDNADVHHQLGDVLEDLGEVRRANEHFESVLRLDGSAFSELADEEQNLARDLATTALARLESATTSRSLKTAVEVLPKPEDVRAGVDPRALSHASEDSTWTVYSANLAFEYGDIEDEEERLLAVIEGLLESAPETLHLSEAELADLGLFPS